MKFVKEVSNAKFVFSKDEVGYQEVLEDFPNADYVLILTFNISEKKVDLINQLEKIKSGTKVNIFSNIPQRYERYYSDSARAQAKKKIDVYIDRLDPEKYQSMVETNFCFNNHSKIIMTNNIVYIGSANYSDESKNNMESGFIITDKSFIDYIKDEIVPYLKDNSQPYYTNSFTRLKIMLSLLYSKLVNSSEEMHMGTHSVADHQEHEFEYYSISDYYFNLTLLESLDSVLHELNEIFGVILEELENNNLLDEELENLLTETDFENLMEIYSADTDMYDLASFDKERYQMDYLADHSLEAYDEYLAGYQESATQEAHEKHEELAEKAKEDILILLGNLKDLQDRTKTLLDKIPNSEQNSKIDNS